MLGGWDVSTHTVYDPVGQTINAGTPGQSLGPTTFGQTLKRIVGPVNVDSGSDVDDSSPSTALATTIAPFGIAAVAPSKNAYWSEPAQSIVRGPGENNQYETLQPSALAGIWNTTVYPSEFSYGPIGDSGPAGYAVLNNPHGVALDSSGDLFIADTGHGVVRVVSMINGRLSSENPIGTAVSGLGAPWGLAFSQDGYLYITDGSMLYQIDVDGNFNVIATNFADAHGVAVGNDGTVYVADYGAGNVVAVYPDGSQTVLISLSAPEGVGVDYNNNVYVTLPAANAVCAVQGSQCVPIVGGNAGSNIGPRSGVRSVSALASGLNAPTAVQFVDGSLYIADSNFISILGPGMPPPAANGLTFLPAKDNPRLVLGVDSQGRHIDTVDLWTGTIVETFNYDQNNLLVSIADQYGNTSTINRDSQGNPISMTGPFGDTTSFQLDSDGNLAVVTDPANQTSTFGYATGGLMTQATDPEQNQSTYGFDPLGNLLGQQNPAGGSTSLSLNGSASAYTVNVSSPGGLTSSTSVQTAPGSSQANISVTAPNGLTTTTALTYGAGKTSTYPTGVSTNIGYGRSSSGLPVMTSWAGQYPNGVVAPRISVAPDTAPLSASGTQNRTITKTINGNTYALTYIASGKTMTVTTPVGRTQTWQYGSNGAVTSRQLGTLTPTTLSYNGNGKATSVVQGSRSYAITYDSNGNETSVSDPVGRTTQYQYDAARRRVATIFPDGSVATFAYNKVGAITAITPPGRPSHSFDYTKLLELADYTPPTASQVGSTSTHYDYNADKELVDIIRPDGQTINFSYDFAGRVHALASPTRTVTTVYSPGGGQLLGYQVNDGSMLAFAYNGSLLTDTTWADGVIAGTIHHDYDSSLRVTSETITNGRAIAFSYDGDSLLTQAGALSLTLDPTNAYVNSTVLGVGSPGTELEFAL